MPTAAVASSPPPLSQNRTGPGPQPPEPSSPLTAERARALLGCRRCGHLSQGTETPPAGGPHSGEVKTEGALKLGPSLAKGVHTPRAPRRPQPSSLAPGEHGWPRRTPITDRRARLRICDRGTLLQHSQQEARQTGSATTREQKNHKAQSKPTTNIQRHRRRCTSKEEPGEDEATGRRWWRGGARGKVAGSTDLNSKRAAGVTDSRATMVTSSAQLRAPGRAASGGSRSSVRRWMLPEPSGVTITQWTRLSVQAGDLNSIPGWEDPLEKEMATSSSSLPRESPWTEEPGGLQSMGLQRDYLPTKQQPKNREVKSKTTNSEKRGQLPWGLPSSGEAACRGRRLGLTPGWGQPWRRHGDLPQCPRL